MRWDDGVYVLDEGGDPVVQSLIDAKTDDLFLDLLQLFNKQNQHVGIVTGTTYAPAKMAGHPKAKGVTKKELAAGMQRLLDAKRIVVVTVGSKTRQRSHLEVVAKTTMH
jgi:hypothetical protein